MRRRQQQLPVVGQIHVLADDSDDDDDDIQFIEQQNPRWQPYPIRDNDDGDDGDDGDDDNGNGAPDRANGGNNEDEDADDELQRILAKSLDEYRAHANAERDYAAFLGDNDLTQPGSAASGAAANGTTREKMLKATWRRSVKRLAAESVREMYPDICDKFLDEQLDLQIRERHDLMDQDVYARPEDAASRLCAVAAAALVERTEPVPVQKPSAATKRSRGENGGSSNDNEDAEILQWILPKRQRRLALAAHDGESWDWRQIHPTFKPSHAYITACRHKLLTEFLTVPVSYVDETLRRCKDQYIPSMLALKRSDGVDVPPFRRLKNGRKPCSHLQCNMTDPTVDDHLHWYKASLAKEAEGEARARAKRERREAAERTGALLECGCCFGDEWPASMVQCIDGHLFCCECVQRLLENSVGDRKAKLSCMHESGCSARFLQSEVERAVLGRKSFTALQARRQRQLLEQDGIIKKMDDSADEADANDDDDGDDEPMTLAQIKKGWKLLRAHEKIAAEASVKNAEIPGFHECPFCDYGAVIPEGSRVFKCEMCHRESCVLCETESHLPLNCQEAERKRDLDNVLNVKHRIEERMSEALMRKCPKCKTVYVKENGCNKIVCSKCKTYMCYVCRQVISGYEHFNRGPPGSEGGSAKCPLHDDTALREHTEVADAERRALEELREKEGTDAAYTAEELNIGGAAGRVAPASTANRAHQLHGQFIPVPVLPGPLDALPPLDLGLGGGLAMQMPHWAQLRGVGQVPAPAPNPEIARMRAIAENAMRDIHAAAAQDFGGHHPFQRGPGGGRRRRRR
ncbi:hypothetical protein BC828DRAFT_371896 [Blastocladiella britannica]|nr:hypothetical protein BC828DRAFT_371896 [Blastocladiella britannica]